MRVHERLLSIEGVDGSGKSTQVAAVARALCHQGVRAQPIVVQAHAARVVNDLAEDITGDRFAYHPAIPAELREWVFACDVAYFCKTAMLPVLEQGTTLVQDRGPLSYRASALYYEGLTPWVARVHDRFLRPWRTYLLDAPEEVSAERLRRRSHQPRQADESQKLIGAVRRTMLEEAARDDRVVVIDAAAEPDVVTAAIVEDWLRVHR